MIANSDKPIAHINNGLQVDGRTDTPDTTAVTVLFADYRGILIAYGDTVPTDGEAGYAKGCIFIDTNASAGAVMYANEGSESSCDFNTSLVSGDISSVVAGLGLNGGGVAGAVTLNVDASHNVLYAGKFTTAGGDANEQISVSGVVATDIVFVSLQDKGATPRTILTAKAGTNVIDLVFSGDPSTDHVVCYQVLRAVA